MAKIFISYASEDADFANRLYEDLRLIGQNPWIDRVEIRPGDNVISRLQDAIRDCEYAIIIISRKAIASTWVDQEWKEHFWESHRTGRLRIVPVLKEQCEVPEFLRTIKYADFSKSYAVGFSLLCMKLRPALFNPRFPDNLIPINYLNAIEWDARTHHVDHIRLACAHTVWSYRPDRALPLLQDAARDMRPEVAEHARILLTLY